MEKAHQNKCQLMVLGGMPLHLLTIFSFGKSESVSRGDISSLSWTPDLLRSHLTELDNMFMVWVLRHLKCTVGKKHVRNKSS